MVKLYEHKVYNTCYSFLKRQDVAEDQAQEVFMTVFRSIHKFEEKSSLSTWIYRIAVTQCLDYLRTQNRKKRRSNGFLSLFTAEKEIPASNDKNPYEHLENQEYSLAISFAVDSLKDKYKTVFVLKYMEGLSQQEIAAITNSTEKSVEGILTRSRGQIRDLLQNYYNEMKD